MENQKGWFNVCENSENFKDVWCILENGVLWFLRKPESNNDFVLDPLLLHDAVVTNDSQNISVNCKRSGRHITLVTSAENSSVWLAEITSSAKDWKARRRASVLNIHQSMQSPDGEIFLELKTTQKTDELQSDEHVYEEVQMRRKSLNPQLLYRTNKKTDGSPSFKTANKKLKLKELAKASGDPTCLCWQRIPEVISSGLLDILPSDKITLEGLKFSIITEELRFNIELDKLIKYTTNAVCWKDTKLETYYRRVMTTCVRNVKYCSNIVLRSAELHWAQKVTMQSFIFTLVGSVARGAGWRDAYYEYCSFLAEIRDLFMNGRSSHARISDQYFSQWYNQDIALIPLQHLTYLRLLLQTIVDMLPPTAPELKSAIVARDYLNEILDSCYQILTELNGPEYVAHMDNELHFDVTELTASVMATDANKRPTTKRLAPPPPTAQTSEQERRFSAFKLDDKGELPVDEPPRYESRKSSIFSGAAIRSAANLLRRRTADKLREIGLKNRTVSLPTLTISLSAPDEEKESSDEDDSSPASFSMPSLDAAAMPRYFANEPFYQSYSRYVAQELLQKCARRTDDEPITPAEPTDSQPCSRWLDQQRVLALNLSLMGKASISDVKRQLTEVKFELISSEASFLRSVRFAEAHFFRCPEFYDEECLTERERSFLLTSLETSRVFSERLLGSLEAVWEQDVFMSSLCRALKPHISSAAARVAATSCLNYRLVDSMLQNMRVERPLFREALVKLEKSPQCAGFTLASFLKLPFLRLGRLKILLDQIAGGLSRADLSELEERVACESARDAVSRLIARADSAAQRVYSDRFLETLSSGLQFHKTPRLAVTAEGRALLHSGPWRVLAEAKSESAPLKPPRKLLLEILEVILLTDILLLIKTESSGIRAVVDCASRESIEVRATGNALDEYPLPGFLTADEVARHALYVAFVGYKKRLTSLVVDCGGAAEQIRWLAAFDPEGTARFITTPARSPQLVHALEPHSPQQLDEMELEVGDVISVSRNPGGGWLLGRNLVNGIQGWIPIERTVPINSGRSKSVTFLIEPLGRNFSLA